MRIYARMCLLGSRWWIITVRVQSPQNPNFGDLNRHFKPNMLKIQTAVSSDLCVRLTWHLTGTCGQQQGLREWSRMVVKQFQDGGQPSFWKSIYRHISVKNLPIFMTWSKNEKVALDRLRVWQNVFLVLKQLHCCPQLNVRVHSSNFQGRTGCGGRPSGWHDIVTCQRL